MDYLATMGDADALNLVGIERDLEDMFQDVPDLHQALISYQEARGKILERKKSRGFWPSTSTPGKGKSKGYGKFQSNRKESGKRSLLLRISRTHCKACAEKGHWKAECPNRPSQPPDSANVVMHQSFEVGNHGPSTEQVIFEDDAEAWSTETSDPDQWGKGASGPVNRGNLGNKVKEVKHFMLPG